ncbi:MAG: aminoacyl-tRNA hydrolase [Coriobacteriales bacterium]|nr:aminoacyl-tRNA hydrolase [Coriobacteriales bacterium]
MSWIKKQSTCEVHPKTKKNRPLFVLPGPHLLVGLGNPGSEYTETRHNAGFMAIDALAKELNANYWKRISDAMVAEAKFQGDQLILAKPLRFMNVSGQPIKGLLKHYGFELSDLLVIHDELDLPEDVLRLKQGGGHGGHNGLRSIGESVGADYARLRVGIGRPPGRMEASDYVLRHLQGQSLTDFQIQTSAAVPIVLDCVQYGVLKAMNQHNTKA